ncbi:hypothetical protein [Streptomyces sp. NPDC002402]
MTDRAESARASNQLTFGDLTDYPVMAQALDNQWLPPDLAAAQQRPQATKGSTSEAVDAASAELRRSLVNSGTLVVNRAYFLNNEALYRNYRPGIEPAEREAFVRLLNDRALVPYLYQERDPGEEAAWSKDKHVQQSWRRLLADEAEPACVRFDWDDDTNREETQKVSNYFSTSLSTLRRLKIPQLAKDLGISQERARALREGVLKDIYDWAGEQDPDKDITRNAVYQQFLCRPGSEPHEQLLREGEDVLPAKQLIDLLYSVGVPKASGLIALTPPDSPARSALQELGEAERSPVADPEALGRLLRDVFADALHRAVDGPNSYADLGLSDITMLRREQEWRDYIDALNGFVRGGFAHGRVPDSDAFTGATTEIAELHAKMLRKARKIGRSGKGFQREIGMALVLESAGLSLQLAGDGVSLLSGSVQLASAGLGALVVRLVFTDGGSALRSGLGHSVTFPTLRLGSVKRDWEALLGAYGERITEIDALPRRNQADQQMPDAP